jgi:hypothetical protein
MDDEPRKRPYERPTLEGSSIFGAEAMTGSCCRTSNATCSFAARINQQITVDPNKIRAMSAS